MKCQKIAGATDDLIGDKNVNKITEVLQNLQ